MSTELLKCSEVAQILRVSKSAVFKLVRDGKLPAVRLERTVRVKSNDLESFIEINTTANIASQSKTNGGVS